ncbi:hypothetical protein GGX14DRAFT_558025 [Mycena pura]|uniref:Uncharacterized protein n=1 Tax=Mycena pura TaxID=153505 RepID=A0AAD7E1F6_9AGAR|nr:hypothetical protein GGX14DRAFT_558025 [Mycena pura]
MDLVPDQNTNDGLQIGVYRARWQRRSEFIHAIEETRQDLPVSDTTGLTSLAFAIASAHNRPATHRRAIAPYRRRRGSAPSTRDVQTGTVAARRACGTPKVDAMASRRKASHPLSQPCVESYPVVPQRFPHSADEEKAYLHQPGALPAPDAAIAVLTASAQGFTSSGAFRAASFRAVFLPLCHMCQCRLAPLHNDRRPLASTSNTHPDCHWWRGVRHHVVCCIVAARVPRRRVADLVGPSVLTPTPYMSVPAFAVSASFPFSRHECSLDACLWSHPRSRSLRTPWLAVDWRTSDAGACYPQTSVRRAIRWHVLVSAAVRERT